MDEIVLAYDSPANDEVGWRWQRTGYRFVLGARGGRGQALAL